MPITNTPSRLAPSGFSELTVEDVADLIARGPHRGALQNIRERHHTIARLLVAGYTSRETAEIVGSHEVTISGLVASPAFQMLLSEYRKGDTEIMLETRRKTAAAAAEGIAALHRRFLDTVALDKVPLHRLSEVTEMLLDRSGVGPVRQHQHTFGLTNDTLAALKSRALETEVILDAEDVAWTEIGEGGSGGAVADSSAEPT